MIYDDNIINTFKNIKLNHKSSIKYSKSKKRKKHVKDIIKRRKALKEAKTIIITKNDIRKTCF